MPALWSPEDLAVRFAPYIEELRDVFVMHRLEFGSPKDIGQLASQLERSSQLNEELAALVRSIVLREGGSIPRTDLLEIVAIAIAGPRMEAAAEDLQQPVRQLLAFLHNALRRPWNEPPGEDKLRDSGADMPIEIGHGARPDEVKPDAARDSQTHGDAEHSSAHRSIKTNVIPFGRARAVFSRLARAESEQLIGDDCATEETEVRAGTVELRSSPPTVSGDSAQLAEAVEEDDTSSAELCQGAFAARHDTDAAPAAAQQEADASPATAAAEAADLPNQVSALPHPEMLSEFDDEPPLPAAPQIHRAALLGGIAATLLIAMGLTAALHGRSAHSVAAAPAEGRIAGPQAGAGANDRSLSAVKPSAIGLPQTADGQRMTAPSPAEASSQPGPASVSGGPLTGRTARAADDDYIAAPYSNLPPQPVSSPEPRVASTAAYTPAAVLEESRPSTPQASEFHSEESGLRDPDGAIVGDRGVAAASAVLSHPPLHPSVPPTVMAENLVSAPLPDYPMLAKLAHVDGPVILHAEITPGGTVADTRVISGHLLLRRAAESAVRHWRYRPYQVDGKAVPVSTTITVKFQAEP